VKHFQPKTGVFPITTFAAKTGGQPAAERHFYDPTNSGHLDTRVAAFSSSHCRFNLLVAP